MLYLNILNERWQKINFKKYVLCDYINNCLLHIYLYYSVYISVIQSYFLLYFLIIITEKKNTIFLCMMCRMSKTLHSNLTNEMKINIICITVVVVVHNNQNHFLVRKRAKTVIFIHNKKHQFFMIIKKSFFSLRTDKK